MKKVILTLVTSFLFIAFANAQTENETEKKVTPTEIETTIDKEIKKVDSTTTDVPIATPIYVEPTKSTEPVDPETPKEPENNNNNSTP